MVLHVIPNIEGDHVQWSIVGICLVSLQEHVMLSYEMSRDRMQAHTQHRTCDKVNNRLHPPYLVDNEVYYELNSCIEDLQLT